MAEIFELLNILKSVTVVNFFCNILTMRLQSLFKWFSSCGQGNVGGDDSKLELWAYNASKVSSYGALVTLTNYVIVNVRIMEIILYSMKEKF